MEKCLILFITSIFCLPLHCRDCIQDTTFNTSWMRIKATYNALYDKTKVMHGVNKLFVQGVSGSKGSTAWLSDITARFNKIKEELK